jgi:DNA (cytosine-5)-methyltransferase 1
VLTHGSLFAGIGGFDLGFERAGMKTVWQVEIDEYCRRVLARHFPDAERFDDVRTVGRHNLKSVDVICGGFPCQDISNSGPKFGLTGARSGLWEQMRRIISELRPRFVVVENVEALLIRGMGTVIGDLAAIGYDAEWECLPMSAFGAAHHRSRIFIVAYPEQDRQPLFSGDVPISIPPFLGASTTSLDTFGHLVEEMEKRSCEPAILGSIDELSKTLRQLEVFGNAVSPDIAEWIGRRIIEASQAEEIA